MGRLMKQKSIFWVIIGFIALGSGGDKLCAQDVIFSQFYANPLYLNPAFAGQEKCLRLSMNYRNQPFPEPGTFSTYSLAADHYWSSLSSGMGLLVMSDRQSNLINTTQVQGIYAYHIQLSAQWHMNLGIQAGYTQYNLNWDNLIFPGQWSDNNTAPPGHQENLPEDWRSQNVDFSTGFIFYTRQAFAGASIHHFAHTSASQNNHTRPAIKYTLHAGMNIPLQAGSATGRNNERLSIAPNLIIQQQDRFMRFNYGMYVNLEPMVVGTWFRHGRKHPNSLIFLLGFSQQKYRIGYSYDYSLSGFSGITQGAHELSVLLKIFCPSENMKYRILDCPTF